jgi:hypothetical protein
MRSEKRPSCVPRLEELEKKMNKQIGYTITRLSDTHVVRFKLPVDDGFQCLPDTVDPRGPKGR